jgi:hypothetical protein
LLRQKDLLLRQKDLSLRQKDLSLRQKDLSLRQKDLLLRQKDLSLRQKDLFAIGENSLPVPAIPGAGSSSRGAHSEAPGSKMTVRVVPGASHETQPCAGMRSHPCRR